MSLILFLLCCPAAMPQQAGGVAGVVAVEAGLIELPPLPASPAEARRNFRARRPDKALAEVEGMLRALYREARTRPMAQPLRVPARHAEEAAFLASLLTDPEHAHLEERVQDLWNAWQSALADRGLADPEMGQDLARRVRLLSARKRDVASHARAGGGDSYFEILHEDREPDRIVASGALRVVLSELMAVDGLEYGGNRDFEKWGRGLAERMAPRLAEAWTPLARHLNARARTLLDYDRDARPTADPAILALRIEAKIAFLERFRSALWFSGLAWAHLASRPLPGPLAELN